MGLARRRLRYLIKLSQKNISAPSSTLCPLLANHHHPSCLVASTNRARETYATPMEIKVVFLPSLFRSTACTIERARGFARATDLLGLVCPGSHDAAPYETKRTWWHIYRTKEGGELSSDRPLALIG